MHGEAFAWRVFGRVDKGLKDDSAVRQAVKRLEAKMRGDRKLARFYEASALEMSKVKI